MLKKKSIIIITIIVGFIVFCIVQNNLIGVSNFEIESSKISRQVRIVHLSDLHDKQFGKGNKILIDKVKQQEPDIIVFTGDLVNWNTKDFTASVNTLSELNKFAQVYFIPGNHEYRSGKSESIFKMLRKVDIEVLNCATKYIIANGEKIDIIGLDKSIARVKTAEKKLIEFEKSSNFKIVLSHFPEDFSRYYCNYNVDLVLSGHAHGGQFDIPFIGGVYAPGQGFFPKYYKGVYSENGVKLVVSRGLGNSKIPLRIFNNPEIVVIDIKPSK
ncbi:metallophosphoesterase [Acetivibrio cellulolyticus]|uniref:metallophosphoesterase n=1 Tax=Acetivibrio cellulolyticus TaxID=35830 RepID=UPI0001E2FB80|nr:metallophosphoesterase [Acetivibrio cellulolyticus]